MGESVNTAIFRGTINELEHIKKTLLESYHTRNVMGTGKWSGDYLNETTGFWHCIAVVNNELFLIGGYSDKNTKDPAVRAMVRNKIWDQFMSKGYYNIVKNKEKFEPIPVPEITVEEPVEDNLNTEEDNED